MPGRRTNNSCSSLEEQSLLIKTMADKASDLPTQNPKGSGMEPEKKSRKKKPTSSQTTSSRKGGNGSDSADDIGTLRNKVATVTAGQSESDDNVSVASTSGGSGAGALGQPPLQQPAFPLTAGNFPSFYPPFAYTGFGNPFGFQSCAEEAESEAMDSASQISAPVREIHDLSEDSDDDVTSNPAPSAPKKQKPSPDFEKLRSGQFSEIIKNRHLKISQADKAGPKINATWASIIDSFFEEPKFAIEADRIAKEYPKPENLEKVVVPKLEQELFSAVDQYARAADIALQNVQKGVVAAISAMAPVGALMLERGDADPELDKLSSNMVDGIHMLALTSLGISSRRREQMKPQLQATYAKALAKAPEGPSEWLYGGNLSESTRKCEVAKRLADKIVKKKSNGAENATNNQQKKGQGQNNKRFKNNNGNWNNNKFGGQKTFGYQNWFTQPMMGFNPQQQQQQQPQQAYGYQQFQPFQMMQPYRPRQPKPQDQQQGQQGFQKRGPQK